MNSNVNQILAEVHKVIVGKDDVMEKILMTLISRGHVLLDDVPGTGKTTAALAFHRALGLRYGRIQFTPDVLPSDIVGFSMPDKTTGNMIYKPGAILCNLFLADELNRATSRTQSALLEAMEENQVTVDGVSHPLPDPFIVIATQNPTGAAGTQLLPDSQMDRFMIRLSIGYPDPRSETEMLKLHSADSAGEPVKAVTDAAGLAAIRRQAANVYIADSVCDYIVALVAATRRSDYITRGASPRASLAVAAMARATAWIDGRDYVVPEDVAGVLIDCLAHRVLFTPEGEDKRDEVLANILRATPRPAIR